MGIYKLKEKQKKSYGEFKKLGIENLERMAVSTGGFIKAIHKKSGRIKAVIGLSGGIDSALTAALAVKALGSENVIAVKMPYRGISSNESSVYADLVANRLGLPLENVMEIPIDKAVNATMEALDAVGVRLDGTRTGNVMARQRMNILYAIAGTKNGMVADTCNKTEILLGYFTRYGDGASDYNPVGGLYKTWVWDLARYLGVPEEVIRRKPTAELSAGQTDEGDIGISYPAMDLMFWLIYDQKVSEIKVVQEYGFPPEVVKMLVRRVELNRFKSELAPMHEIEI